MSIDTCWSRIGDWGDRTCPELPRVVTCRECPVHAAAAMDILDRPAPPSPAPPPPLPPAPPSQAATLLFRVGAEWYGLEPGEIGEIGERAVVHSLPHQRGGLVLGLVNVRGELVVCVSLAQALQVPVEQSPARRATPPRLLVLGRGARRLATPVDEVFGLHRYDPALLAEAPVLTSEGGRSHVRALLRWDERTVGLLDAASLWPALERALG